MRAVRGICNLALLAAAGALLAGRGAVAQPAAAPATTCAKCHRAVSDRYAHSPMRNALAPESGSAALQEHPNLSLQQNGYNYTLQTKNGKSTYTVSDSTGTMTLPIRWILGQKSQTMVLEKDGRYYESLVSYFERDMSLATTPGDENIVPHTLTEAMGRELPIWEVRNCFTCHASDYNPEEPLDTQKLTPGLSCERCHAGATEHMADAARDDLTSLPDSLGQMNAGETSKFCGQCHRTWDKVVREGWRGPMTVRFSPYRLANSKCFDAKDKRIGCLACHDPHRDVERNDTFYDAKCLACHSAGRAAMSSSASATSAAPAPRTCPVAKEHCVSCHMPKVAIAGGHATFTDHQIRIVQPGETYPN